MTNKQNFNGGFSKIVREHWPVDILLKAGDSDESKAISAHKIVLGMRSDVFKKMFESEEMIKTSNTLETITFSEMKQEELFAFANYLYSCGCCFEKHKLHVKSLYIAADKYEIPHLRDECRKELMETLNTSNAVAVLEIAQIPFDKVLHDKAFGFISKNLKVISNLAGFKLFVVRQPELTVKLMNAALAIPPPVITAPRKAIKR